HGMATLPRLGDVPISTWPPDAIRPRLTGMYAGFLRDPSVEGTLVRRVARYGSGLKRGPSPADPAMAVQAPLARAARAAPDGNRDHVELLRGDKRLDTDLTLGSTVEQLRLRSGDQLFVPQRSWLSRNTWLVGSIIGATATIVAVVLR